MAWFTGDPEEDCSSMLSMKDPVCGRRKKAREGDYYFAWGGCQKLSLDDVARARLRKELWWDYSLKIDSSYSLPLFSFFVKYKL